MYSVFVGVIHGQAAQIGAEYDAMRTYLIDGLAKGAPDLFQ